MIAWMVLSWESTIRARVLVTTIYYDLSPPSVSIEPSAACSEGQEPAHNVGMRSVSDRRRNHEGQELWRQQVRLSRGHWREEGPGAVHSAGWWESVTVTWSPAPGGERRPAVVQRALATAADMITPLLADIAAASAKGLLERRHRARRVLSLSRRHMPSAAKELTRS